MGLAADNAEEATDTGARSRQDPPVAPALAEPVTGNWRYVAGRLGIPWRAASDALHAAKRGVEENRDVRFGETTGNIYDDTTWEVIGNLAD